MISRLLLDTHVIVRWLVTPKKLSREQTRALRDSVRRHEPLGVSALSLLELAILFGEGSARGNVPVHDLFHELEANPAFVILPVTVELAAEVAAMGNALRDPVDRALVATARVFRLRLVTSDERIITSRLVPVIA